MKTRLAPTALSIHRRAFLGRAAQGVGALALASLLDPSLLRAPAQPPRGTSPALPLPQKAKRVIWLTMAGGPSQLETFDPKPKLAAWTASRCPSRHARATARPAPGPEARLPRADVPVPEVRQERHRDQRAVPAYRLGDRRDLPGPVDDDRRDQSRSGPHVHEHRLADRRPAEHGRLGHLRPGQRGRGPARLRRPGLDRQGAFAPADRGAAVGQRLLAQPVPGRAGARPGGGRALSGQPRGRVARAAGGRRRRDQRPERAARRRGGRPRDRHPHRPVRDGVPDAGERPRADGHPRREPQDARALRLPAGRRFVRLATACSPAAWPSAACGSSSSITATGTTTACSARSCPSAPARSTRRARP